MKVETTLLHLLPSRLYRCETCDVILRAGIVPDRCAGCGRRVAGLLRSEPTKNPDEELTVVATDLAILVRGAEFTDAVEATRNVLAAVLERRVEVVAKWLGGFAIAGQLGGGEN